MAATDSVGKMFERLKSERKYRPTELEFKQTIKNCKAKKILAYLKQCNSLGTVLHSLVSRGYKDLVRCALHAVRKEDINSLLMITCDTSKTAFHCAASSQCDDPEITALLLNSVKGEVERFSILKTTDTGGNTALHCAVSCENRQIIQAILSKVPLAAAKELMLMQNKSHQNIYDIAREKTCEDTIAHLNPDHKQLTKSTKDNQADSKLTQSEDRLQQLEKELKETRAENKQLRDRMEALEGILRGNDLPALLEQIPMNTSNIHSHRDRLDRNADRLDQHEEELGAHSESLKVHNERLEHHRERIEELEIPNSHQCPDGGESGNELAEYEGAGYPTQESSK